MQRFFAGLLLALPLSAVALEGGVSLGGAVKVDGPLFGHQSNAIDRLAGHLRFGGHWRVGLEALYRQDSRPMVPVPPNPWLGPNPTLMPSQDRSARSIGMTVGASLRAWQRHEFGIGAAAGVERLHFDEPWLRNDVRDGRYHALFVHYDVLITDHISIGLAGRRHTDRILRESPACAVNCTGLSNVVYNPYTGLGGAQKVRSESLSVSIGYHF